MQLELASDAPVLQGNLEVNMYLVASGLFLMGVVALTVCAGQLSLEEESSVRSLQKYGRHVCNAVQISGDVFITPAACLSGSDPVGMELIPAEEHSKVTHKSGCSVTRYQSHPKYVFLSHNVGLMQCGGQTLSVPQNIPIRESKKGDRLTLVGVNESLKTVSSRVKAIDCLVCKKEYATFDCQRQLCLKPTGKVFQKLSTVEGLAGAGIFTQNAKLAGMLSYGFPANGSLVAERAIYYKQFLHRTLQAFTIDNRV